jgi:hypothetical protein
LGQIAVGTSWAKECVAGLSDAALHMEARDIRVDAIKVLSKFGGDAASALPVLHALQNDPSEAVGAAATESIVALETQAGTNPERRPPR